jgi:hypothetical protein
MVPRVVDMEIRQFWKEKMTDSVFSHSTDIMYKKKMKIERTKNKVLKPRGAIRYLIPFFFLLPIYHHNKIEVKKLKKKH